MKLTEDDLTVKTYLYDKYFVGNDDKLSEEFTSNDIYEHFKTMDNDGNIDEDRKYNYDRYYIDGILDNLANVKILEENQDSESDVTHYKIKKEIPLLNSFEDFKKALESFQKANQGKRLYFRGEEGYYPFSIPSIYRNKYTHGLEKKSNRFYSDLLVELGSLKIFNQPLSTQFAKFQHYQAPTRLIDITANPLAALFFALEGKNSHNRKVYFYAVDPEDIKYQDGHTVNVEAATNLLKQKEVVRQFLKNMRKFKNYKVPDIYPDEHFEKDCENKELKKSIKDFMAELNLKNKLSEQMNHPNKIFDDLNIAHFVEFIRESDRMKNQQGAFIIPKYLTGYEEHSESPYQELQESIQNAVTDGLDDNGQPKGFKCFTILHKNVEKLREYLNFMGVNSGSIYPDIEHYSNFLIERYQNEGSKNSKDLNN